MLRRSWSIILDASVNGRAMVMRGSMAADIIRRVCSVDPWLIWVQPATTQADSEETGSPGFYVQAGFGDHLAHAQRSGSDSWEVTRGPAELGRIDQPTLLLPKSKSVTETQVKQLIHALGVPRFYLEALPQGLRVYPPGKVGCVVSDNAVEVLQERVYFSPRFSVSFQRAQRMRTPDARPPHQSWSAASPSSHRLFRDVR